MFIQDLVRHFYNAFRCSWKGLKYAYQTQWAFRIELVILAISIPFVFILGRSAIEYILLLSGIVVLMVLELVNTGIETTINRISTEFNELSGLAKDLASAAVFVAGLNVVLIWGGILLRDLMF